MFLIILLFLGGHSRVFWKSNSLNPVSQGLKLAVAWTLNSFSIFLFKGFGVGDATMHWVYWVRWSVLERQDSLGDSGSKTLPDGFLQGIEVRGVSGAWRELKNEEEKGWSVPHMGQTG